jgi:ABC-2 type transport system permease protein
MTAIATPPVQGHGRVLPHGGAATKYLAIASVAVAQRLDERSLLISRAVFYALVLFIFSQVWNALASETGDASSFVWYLAVTEWVLLAQPRLFAEIERDVRSGEIAYQLTRPAHYLAVKLAESVGEMLLAMTVLGCVGVITALLLTSGLPQHPLGLLFALVLGLLAGVVLLLAGAVIGLCAFWLQDCSPLYWVWQKAVFVLGGLFVPLALYPEWLRVLSLCLPFSAVIGGPGSMLLHPDPLLFALLALKLAALIAIARHVLEHVFERAIRQLTVNGG